MNDFDLGSVIDDVLDGVATPEQQAWLTQRLAADPAARELHARRESLFRALDGPPLTDAPAELLPAVLRGISDAGRLAAAPAPAYTAARPDANDWLASLVEAFRHRPAMAWGYAASMAAIAVALTFAAVRLPSAFGPQSLPVQGTIGLPSPGAGDPLASATLVEPDASVTVEAYPAGAGTLQLVVRTETRATAPSEVALDLDDAETVSRGAGLAFGREAYDPASHLRARFDHTETGSVVVRPAHPGQLVARITLRSPSGVSHGRLSIGATPEPAR